MSVTERSSARKSLIRIPELSETTWLAAIAVGFLVLHLLTAILLMPVAKSDPASQREETRAVLTD
ncbi:hypothetical protein UP10_29245 [Bradyrhizobium sp. LTSPM299]|jgi:hypothetical protein|uniref:hypothetical protein n=1 Tax=Bradyrhizobium sp. LTSPM299 TaxID=1619233 RepID=UPI0005CB7DBA|nr:hypothetical protein [Bradyrhizobium sp. LTSPM299]KJC57172.1 hypothetical protein UP10_29245 [Bradyrhizobium sp. LTSPM299]